MEEGTKCIRKKFRFLFEGHDIEKFRQAEREREKKILDEKIRAIKLQMRRELEKRRVWEMAESIQDEINDYLLKASKPRNDFERMLNAKMVKELGTVTSVRELSGFLKMNKNCIYKGMDTGEILSIRKGRRRLILTEGILPFLREH